jgi:hypothetical protein
MAKTAENAGVRNAEIAIEFFGGEGGAAFKQIPIGPCGAADIGEKQLLGGEHGESIYGRFAFPIFESDC